MSWGREALRSHVRVARSRKSDVRSSLPQEKRIPVVPSGDSTQLDFMPDRFKTLYVLGLKLMLAERDKHYPSRSKQTSLAAAVTNITKPVT